MECYMFMIAIKRYSRNLQVTGMFLNLETFQKLFCSCSPSYAKNSWVDTKNQVGGRLTQMPKVGDDRKFLLPEKIHCIWGE